MNWTKEPPTEPGWYWWRPYPGHETIKYFAILGPEWVEIGKELSLTIRRDELDRIVGGEWGERIPEPPKEK